MLEQSQVPAHAHTTNSADAGATHTTIEISIDGAWRRVAALAVGGRMLVTKGKWIRVASVHDEEWLDTAVDNPEWYIETLRHEAIRGFKADIFTFAQGLSETAPEHRYPLTLESVAAIRLGGFKDWWENLPQGTRKNVKRAQKRGVVVRVVPFDEELLRGIVEINNDTQMRQGRRNRHYGKTLEQVRKDEESFTDRSDFLCAYREDEIIGFVKLVYTADGASILNFASKVSEYENRPTNALIAKAVELCIAKRVPFLKYGLFNYGNKRDSLREFKIRNGFEEMLVPRYYAPLTARGALAIRCGLHRGVLHILPSSFITCGLKVRARWYQFTGLDKAA